MKISGRAVPASSRISCSARRPLFLLGLTIWDPTASTVLFLSSSSGLTGGAIADSQGVFDEDDCGCSLNPFFETDCSGIVFERRKVWYTIKPGFAVERDRFRLLYTSFQSDGVILKIPGKPREFFQDFPGDSATAFTWNNKHPLYLCYFILDCNQCP